MSTAPKGSYNSWLLPDGRWLRCALVITGAMAHPRSYSVTADGAYLGEVVRWRSIGIWRVRGLDSEWSENWVVDEDGSPREWPSRGDAIDYLLGVGE